MKKIISLLVTAIFAFLYYYITLPAINFQAEEFYVFLLVILVVYVTLEIALNSPKILTDTSGYFRYIKHHAKIPFFIALALILVLFAGPVLSWELFRASDYKNLLTVTEGNFTEDITEISYQQIPTLDRDSASLLISSGLATTGLFASALFCACLSSAIFSSMSALRFAVSSSLASCL